MSLTLYAPIIMRLTVHDVPAISVTIRKCSPECTPERLIYRFLPVDDAITDRTPPQRAIAVVEALPDHTVEPLTFLTTLHNAVSLNDGTLHSGDPLAFCIELLAGYED